MRLPGSLQVRLALSLGILLTLLWISAASVTAIIVRYEMDEVFDSALQETAQRLLPLA
ncbi:two-component sensor histidine kinase, partial [Amaricoccus sp. HAR-UPW-R2A-40]